MYCMHYTVHSVRHCRQCWSNAAAPKRLNRLSLPRYRRTPGGYQCKRSEKTHAFSITSKRIHRRMPAAPLCEVLDLLKLTRFVLCVFSE